MLSITKGAEGGERLDLCFLVILAGCGVSTRELPTETADVVVDIAVEQETRRVTDGADWDFTQVRAELRTAKGAAIEKADVQLLLNGEPLLFVVGTGNYYDRHPFYKASEAQLARINDSTECGFELIWPDGTRHPVGRIRTPRQLSIDQFTFPREHKLGSRLAFGWRDVTSPAEVVVYRGLSYPDKLGNPVSRVGTPGEAAIRKTIGPGFLKKKSGELDVPSTFFDGQPGDYQSDHKPQRVKAVYVDVTARTRAPVSRSFHSASRINAVRKIQFYIEARP